MQFGEILQVFKKSYKIITKKETGRKFYENFRPVSMFRGIFLRNWIGHAIFLRRRRRSDIIAMNSLLVGFPLLLWMV